jgi:hypothetical protein
VTLKNLLIENCPSITAGSFPVNFNSNSSLRELKIMYCAELESLPSGFPSSLQVLHLIECKTTSSATWNGGERLTTMLSYIKKEPKDGTINELRPSNSSREIRYFSLTLVFIYLVMISFVVSGKAHT